MGSGTSRELTWRRVAPGGLARGEGRRGASASPIREEGRRVRTSGPAGEMGEVAVGVKVTCGLLAPAVRWGVPEGPAGRPPLPALPFPRDSRDLGSGSVCP